MKKNSEFIFFYYDKTIDANKKISLRVENASILFVLNKLFQDTDIKYEIKDRQISLKKEGKVVPQKKKVRNKNVRFMELSQMRLLENHL